MVKSLVPIEVESICDELNKAVYVFNLVHGSLVLDSYLLMWRGTRRKGWQVLKRYNRLVRGDLRFEDVPKDEEVLSHARQKLVEQIEAVWDI